MYLLKDNKIAGDKLESITEEMDIVHVVLAAAGMLNSWSLFSACSYNSRY